MSVLDATTRRRLERLRETDSSGVYASEDFTEGNDPDGALTATVDPTGLPENTWPVVEEGNSDAMNDPGNWEPQSA